MKVKISASKELTAEEKRSVWNFLDQFDYIPYQQFPEYPWIEGVSCRYFIARDGDVITGWAQAIEKRNMLAVVEFGPVAKDANTVTGLFLFILQYYKKKLYSLVRWMPYWYKCHEYETTCAALKSRFRLMNQSKLINWTSKRISLDEEAEAILKNFSENHRRNIKKAKGLQIDCRKIVSENEVEAFVKGYIQMYEHRKLKVDPVSVQQSFLKLFRYLNQGKRGFFLGAFRENVLLGGLIIIFQGKTAFYYKGYIDHEQKKMPINHIAFYEAILLSKEEQMHWFDFGGYARNTTDEQLININKFKDGFKGTEVNFPNTQMIGLNYFSGLAESLLSLKSI